MFTPPPSPLSCPPRTYSEKQPGLDGSDDDDAFEYVPYHDAFSPPPTPFSSKRPASPRSPTAKTSPTPWSKKSSRRRIIIPLVAVILVLVAAVSRFRAIESNAAPILDLSLFFDNASLSNPSPRLGLPNAAAAHEHHLRSLYPTRKRQIIPSPDASILPSTTSTPAGIPASTSTPPAIQNPPLPVPTPFPQSFDTTFSYNFTTSSCQSFFANSLLSNLTYRQCRPLSLLIPSSSAFFQAQSNLTLLTSIVGGTCNTVRSEGDCVATMAWLLGQMRDDTVCGKDLAERNAIVLEALNGFMNYQFMREAGCLVNQRTNSYCFVDAVASTSVSDFYFYTLPLGTPLPNKTALSCSACVQSLMGIYATQANNKSLDISKTYESAAVAANAACGQQYATVVDAASFATQNVGGTAAMGAMLLATVVGVVVGMGLVGL